MGEKLHNVNEERLKKLLQLSGGLIAAIDGLWFLTVEKEFCNNEAIRLDKKVWKKYVHVLVKRMRNLMGITPEGIKEIRKIIEIDPLFSTIDYEISEPSNNTVLLAINRCPVLEAMEKAGREKYVCESTTGLYFRNLAKEIDPKIIVYALKLPPRKYLEDMCCKWLFQRED